MGICVASIREMCGPKQVCITADMCRGGVGGGGGSVARNARHVSPRWGSARRFYRDADSDREILIRPMQQEIRISVSPGPHLGAFAYAYSAVGL